MKRGCVVLFRSILLVSVIGSLVPVLAPAVPAAAQDPGAPPLETIDCGDWQVASTAICGYVTVPENRAIPGGRTIRLAVVVFPATGDDPQPEPVIYLDGGPSADTLPTLSQGLFSGFVRHINRQHDVIMFDQRGVGFSEPRLDCPELDALFLEAIQVTYDPARDDATWFDAAEACRSRWMDEGVDLTAYHTAASAADIDDIRLALGYDHLNLFAISYGTFLAQYVLRDYADTVRSAVLDSVVPVDRLLSEGFVPNALRVFDLLFETCAADTSCNARYPDLEAVFWELVDQLNAEPVSVRAFNPADYRQVPVMVDGNMLIDTVFANFYSPGDISQIPAMLYELQAGRTARLANMLSTLLVFGMFANEAMAFSVDCTDLVPGTDPAVVAASVVAAGRPEIDAYFAHQAPISNLRLAEFCARWPVTAEPAGANDPVTGDVPTLVLAGNWDPITPPAWSELVASHLSRSTYVLFPAQSHGAGYNSCGFELMQAFWADPLAELDTGCAAEQPRIAFR